MSETKNVEDTMSEEYDEEADEDFEIGHDDDELMASSSGDEAETDPASKRPTKRRRLTTKDQEDFGELDSGDDATIRERKKSRYKQKRKNIEVEDNSDSEEAGWKARTRATRERDREFKKKNKLSHIKGSTIDVDKVWEEMNKPGGPQLPPPTPIEDPKDQDEKLQPTMDPLYYSNQENLHPAKGALQEVITIRRMYRFAGELHTEEKTVPKSSAAARLWLTQQSSGLSSTNNVDAVPLRRPLRKVSRFDPNINNLALYTKTWQKTSGSLDSQTGPKLNVVEKSKMDWAAHVDREGFKEELDEHAKAKEGYLSRMDFLGSVVQKKEEEARLARLKG